jgi:adenylate cyclase
MPDCPSHASDDPSIAAPRTARTSWALRFADSLPLGLKWSLAIAALIVVAMGMLGFHLIQQQERVYREQADRFSGLIVEQLLRFSGEPLMAGDSLTLQLLLQRHVQSPMVVGAALTDVEGRLRVEAGTMPPGSIAAAPREGWEWSSDGIQAMAYRRPVIYQDVVAGELTVSFDRRPLEEGLAETLRFLALSTALLIGVGVIGSFVLAYQLSRPIQRLARAGRALGGELPDDGRRRDEIGQVLESFQHLAEGYRRKAYAEATLSRYVSPQVAERLLADQSSRPLENRRVDGSVLFCDIVGFTGLSEQWDPGEVAALLNHYFAYFAAAAESCRGTVDKFIGDAIMVVFGVPEPDAHHGLHALTCGLLMQRLVRRLNRERVGAGEPGIRLRVGVSSGPMMAGNLGSSARMQYTVIGDTVNVAARLCAMAEPGGVLLTEQLLGQGAPGSIGHYRRIGPSHLRGRAADVDVCAMDVDAVASEIDADRLIEELLSGGVS